MAFVFQTDTEDGSTASKCVNKNLKKLKIYLLL